MPEPVPYYPPGTHSPASYSSQSYSLHTSSSSGAPSLSHRTTASSTTSDHSSHLPRYSNGLRPTSDGEKTPISSNEYLPHPSSSSYFDGVSSGNYLSNINETGNVYRPPGAFPPNVPSYSGQSPSFNPYPDEELQVANGYRHQESHPNQPHQIASYGPQPFKPPPPPPLPVASQHTASSSKHHFDSYAKADGQVPSRAPQCDYPEAGPSNIGIASQEDEETDWDPNSYVYADSYDGPEGLAPGGDLHRATEMLRSIADYSPRGRLELHDEPQDEFWEDEDEDDESRFVNFSLLSHIAVQLRDKVPRGTHVKGNIPYPRAFTGKDIVVCTFPAFFFVRCKFTIISLQVNHTITNPA